MISAIVFDVDGVILQDGKLIQDSYDFIVQNYKKYSFFTNSSLSKKRLQEIFLKYDLGKCFMEILGYEDGDKRENIEYILQVYSISSDTILFIDDSISNLAYVANTQVDTLLFRQDGVSLQQKINTKLNT